MYRLPHRDPAFLGQIFTDLEQYCGRNCQITDWKHHKVDCKSKYLKERYVPQWEVENRMPAFAKGPPLASFGSLQYLWGNVPALDILKVKHNEGDEAIENQSLALLFAASGDLRNIIKTVLGLSESYAGHCIIVANDFNTAIVARNAMLLLTALHFEPEVATPIMLHLWYSAFLPHKVLQALQGGILPYICDVCEKIKDKKKDSVHAKTFTIGKSSVRLILKKWEWLGLANMFRVSEGLGAPEAQSIRHSVTMARVDHIDRHIHKMSPGRRAGAMRFRAHGVLLPFGASRKDFSVPNPQVYLQ